MIPEGIVRYFNLLELSKTRFGRAVTPVPIEISSSLFPAKVAAPIEVTEFGITSFVKFVFMKVLAPIVVKPSLRVSDVRGIFANAKLLIVVTLLGITNDRMARLL